MQIDGILKEYGCEKTEELEERTAVQNQILAELKEENRQAQLEMEVCRQKSDRAILENKAFEELQQLENRVNVLQRQMDGFDAEEVLLKNADTAEKIRQTDTAESVSLSYVEDCPALRLKQQADDNIYETYIYYYDGALREVFVKEGTEATLLQGTAIVELPGFSIEEKEYHLYQLTAIKQSGDEISMLIRPKSQ